MQDFIEFLKQHNELKIIDTPLDIELEIPHLAYIEVKKKDSKALLFTRPIHRNTHFGDNYHAPLATPDLIKTLAHTTHLKEDALHLDSHIIHFSTPVLMNIFGSFRRLELIANFYNTKAGFKDIESIATAIRSLLNPAMPRGVQGKLKKLGELWRARHIFPKNYKNRTYFLESMIYKIQNTLNKFQHSHQNLYQNDEKDTKNSMIKQDFSKPNIQPKNILKNTPPKKLPPCQDRIYTGDEINLFSLPILKTWEDDGGHFITMGQVYTRELSDFNLGVATHNDEWTQGLKCNQSKGNKNEDSKPQASPDLTSYTPSNNLGLYRLQVKSKNELLMHWQIHKDATHFFHQYERSKRLMPVSIAIGGDPLYTWCAQAPLPPKMFELMLYGLIRGKSVRMAKCVSNELSVPFDSDIVIEGYVDTSEFALEGRFGDHTGFYTPVEPYPVLRVSAITMKAKPVYLATVVGKPPLEDKYMGYMTERVFLPLLQTSVHGLLDYSMPENGVFHNLIFARVKCDYPAQSLQIMHAFFGLGQLSFVKHAVFVKQDAPNISTINGDYKILTDYILDRVSVKNLVISTGICDALDHACKSYAVSGKLGIDATGERVESFGFEKADSSELLSSLKIACGVQDTNDQDTIDMDSGYEDSSLNMRAFNHLGGDKEVGLKDSKTTKSKGKKDVDLIDNMNQKYQNIESKDSQKQTYVSCLKNNPCFFTRSNQCHHTKSKNLDSTPPLNYIEITALRIYHHRNPIIICEVKKQNAKVLDFAQEFFDVLHKYSQFIIFIDSQNEIDNNYMLMWRIVNSIDVARDLKIIDSTMGCSAFLDATSKGKADGYASGYNKQWPKDVLCTPQVIESLRKKGLLEDIDDEFLAKFGIL